MDVSNSGINPEIAAKSFVDFKNKESLNVNILWASAREIYNLIQAVNAGCEIITLNETLIDKIKNIGKDLNSFSLETVKMFYEDAINAGYKIWMTLKIFSKSNKWNCTKVWQETYLIL